MHLSAMTPTNVRWVDRNRGTAGSKPEPSTPDATKESHAAPKPLHGKRFVLGSLVALTIMAGPSYSAPPPPSATQSLVVNPETKAPASVPTQAVAPAQPAAVAPQAEVSLNGTVIVIDAGHGGPDQGASTLTPLVLEKDVNLDIALRLRSDLVARGATVIMTRSDDREVAVGPDHKAELQARSNVSNRADADLFVSIHNNASTNANARGTEVYVSRTASPQSRALADAIFDQLDSDLPTQGNGVKTAGYYVLRHTSAPAVLAEVAYLSNVGDARLINDPTVRQDAADAIADGIGEYLIGQGAIAQAPATPTDHMPT